MTTLQILYHKQHYQEKAEQLSRQLNCPIGSELLQADLSLLVDDTLSIIDNEKNSKPICIDFSQQRLQQRKQSGKKTDDC